MIDCKAPGSVGAAGIQSVSYGVIRSQVIQIVKLRGLAFHRIVLENEIPQTVEYGFIFVNLNAAPDMGTVSDIGRRPGINTKFCKIAAEIRRPVLRHPFAFVAVVADKYKIRLPFRFFNGTDDPVRILFVHGGDGTGHLAAGRSFKADLSDQVTAGQRLIEPFFFQQHTVGIHFGLIDDFAQGFQFFRFYLVNRLVPQHVGAGASQHIPPRVGSHPPLVHGRCHTDNRHTALGQIQIPGLGCFFQIDPAAGVDNTGGIQMLFGS